MQGLTCPYCHKLCKLLYIFLYKSPYTSISVGDISELEDHKERILL